MKACAILLATCVLLICNTASRAEQSAELHLLLEGTERFQQNVLELEADILRLEQNTRAPAKGRVSLFLNTALGGRYRLEEISLSLNGKPLLELRYSHQQRRALAEGGTQPLQTLSLPPGKHRLQMRFIVGEGEKRHRGNSELEFVHGETETWLELRVEDVPGEIFKPADDARQTPPPRRIEMSAGAWEAPR